MTRPLIARCDQCKNITTINYRIKKHPGELEETYFTCDVCNHHYTCFVKDKKVMKMQTKAKNLRAVSKFKDVTIELMTLQKKINNRMNKLKQRVVSNE